ncbi:Protein of unknown function [Saccharicrinis carchari]|uniref:DUF3078 domain-containing protein n=1 Tax=Saccharicrinis carchari TaxID=1168039 RepID=A0A521AT83_SACCC|nr:DUF3078 domain-containing protein [Saccharicrinis carchari]SMO37941.1 Protein of unknown function [Saccharicrinis carchari]
MTHTKCKTKLNEKLQITAILFLSMLMPTTWAQQQNNDTLKTWKGGGSMSLNFSQVSLTNWAGGGNNSVAGTFLFKGFLNHKNGKLAWDNTLDLGYGLSKQGDYKLAKSEDKIQLATKLGYEAGKHWYYSALVDLKTQLAIGYKDPLIQSVKVSDFMAPGYVQFSLGMDYKPSDNFSLYLSPITSKLTVVAEDSLADVGAFGVDPGDKVRSEYGASLKLLAKKNEVLQNVNVYTRLDMFSNYSENPENIDVDWEFGLEMKVNKYLNAIFTTNLVYDDDVHYINDSRVDQGPKTQVKQMFGAGLSYSF